MPVPSDISELSQTAGSNYPTGSESPITTDDYFRTYAAFIAVLRDGKGHSAEVDVASAGTCDIGAANTHFVRITGTTTITSFGTNYNGPRFIRFGGALTLTHNASSLILPTGASITTVAGDTCIATPLAAGWVVYAYQRASGAPLALADNTVSTAKLQNSAVTTAKIADSNVTTAKIADSNVTTAKIADSNVTTAKIADANITPAKLSGAQSGSAPIYGARAWVNFNGTGVLAIRSSGNVSSVTDFGTGTYAVVLTTPLADANYAACATAGNVGNLAVAITDTFTTGGFRLLTFNNSNTLIDADPVSVIVLR